MIDLTKPVEVAQGLWWVGSENTHHNLQCNPYLFIKDGLGILFDPGSVLDGQVVLEKTTSLLPLSNLKAIVCSHQDPDLCAAIPLFEKAGFKGDICCHARAALLIQYYGIKNPFYMVNHHSFSYTLNQTTSIGFIFTPYLHFPGSIMSYLPEQQALISGDLFGSITADWKLYADENYLDGMKAFHEVYMPGHEILAAAMESLESYPIRLICPQHGSIIDKNIEEHINTLKTMPCGLFIQSKQLRLPLEGGVRALIDQVVKRLITIYGEQEIRKTFEKSPFTLNVKMRQIVKTTLAEDQMWESFFSTLEERRGVAYLSSISSFVELLGKQYGLGIPSVFSTLIASSERQIKEKTAELKELEEKLQNLQESMYRDPVTGLYNKEFHQAFMLKELAGGSPLVSVVLAIDNLERINLDHGSTEGDRTMRILSQVILQSVDPHVQVCRITGGMFALLCTSLTKEQAIERAAALGNRIAGEDRFIVPITVSMGIAHSDEVAESSRNDVLQMASDINALAAFRLRLARKKGTGSIVAVSSSEAGSRSAFAILLVDVPSFSRDLLKQTLEKERYRVLTADNGLEAKKMLLAGGIDLVLCELLVPKLGALTLRKELLGNPSTAGIPFLLMSANKQEQTVRRAFDLGIQHFLARPLALYELTGLVNLIASKEA